MNRHLSSCVATRLARPPQQFCPFCTLAASITLQLPQPLSATCPMYIDQPKSREQRIFPSALPAPELKASPFWIVRTLAVPEVGCSFRGVLLCFAAELQVQSPFSSAVRWCYQSAYNAGLLQPPHVTSHRPLSPLGESCPRRTDSHSHSHRHTEGSPLTATHHTSHTVGASNTGYHAGDTAGQPNSRRNAATVR